MHSTFFPFLLSRLFLFLLLLFFGGAHTCLVAQVLSSVFAVRLPTASFFSPDPVKKQPLSITTQQLTLKTKLKSKKKKKKKKRDIVN